MVFYAIYLRKILGSLRNFNVILASSVLSHLAHGFIGR